MADRLAKAEERLRAIGGRRAEGDERPDDAEQAALLHADVAGLRDLLARRDAEVEAAQAPMREAAAALASAEHLLARAEALALEAALISRADEAARVLAEALQQARQVRKANGGGLIPFTVTDALWNELVPIRHLRPW